MSDVRRARLVEVVRAKGHLRLSEPVELASGLMSDDFVDAKRALECWEDLKLAGELIAEGVHEAGIEFDAVGGLTLGADALAVGVAAAANTRWFVVRKEAKARGTGNLIEGALVTSGTRLLLVDDVVTTGGSLLRALEAVQAAGADVRAASAVVDRGETAAARLSALGVWYRPLLTYRDLGIDPVGPGTPPPV